MKHNVPMRYLLVAAGALVVGLLVAGTSWQSLLPMVLLLACPLMMMFMMRSMGGPDGHGGHGGHDGGAGRHDHEPTDRDQADPTRRL